MSENAREYIKSWEMGIKEFLSGEGDGLAVQRMMTLLTEMGNLEVW